MALLIYKKMRSRALTTQQALLFISKKQSNFFLETLVSLLLVKQVLNTTLAENFLNVTPALLVADLYSLLWGGGKYPESFQSKTVHSWQMLLCTQGCGGVVH